MEPFRPGSWLDRQTVREAARDRMRQSDRLGDLIGVVIAIIFAVYFTILYTSNSGFFTTQFTTADAVLFFGIAYLGIIPGLVRIILGHRNAVRPLDVLLSISVLAAAIWFLFTFPFDFSFVADALPSSLQFPLSWISDGLVQAIMVITIIASVFIIPYTALLYLGVRQKLAIKKEG